MKKMTLLFCATSIILFSCNNSASNTEEKKDSTAKKDTTAAFVPVDSATANKNYKAYVTPSEAHKMMASWDGVWTTEATGWMSPDGPPMKSTGISTNKTVLNGLFQESVFKGNMMGMPFEGHGTMGYDNAKKMFVSSWIDNMGSGLMKLEGPWDAASKTITMTGKVVNGETGKECDMKEIFKIVDDNTQIFEMYGPNSKDGKEYKMMEIKYTRKK